MALTPEQLRQGFSIGDRRVQPALNRISGPGGDAHIEPKVMAVLVCLAEHAGDVVSRAALYDAVWGKAVVSDQALTNCISELRHHLGDDRAGPRYIETVPKRGYRLMVPLGQAGTANGNTEPEPASRSGSRRLALAYVYKYGGMLEESQRHCGTAYALDRHNPDLRSCGYSFLYAGKLDRVQAFLDADAGSYFSHWGRRLREDAIACHRRFRAAVESAAE